MSDRVQLGSFLQDGENFMNSLHNQTLELSQALTRDVLGVRNSYNKWESIAKLNGFNSMEDVMNFLRQHGLVVDGKVGKNTLAKMLALKDAKVKQLGQLDWMNAMKAAGYKQSTLKDGSIAFSDGRGNTYYNNGRMRAKGATSNTNYDYKNLKPFGPEQKTSTPTATPTATPSNYWRDHYVAGNRYHYIDGKKYNVRVNTEEDLSYAYDPETNKYMQLEENFMGKPTGVAKGATWMSEDEIPSIALRKRKTAWLAANPEPKMRGPLGGTTTPEWKEWSKKALVAQQAGWQKNGGIMTKKYQQGGTAPQQDMQQLVVALVQAAMQGDQKATQQVTLIMEAAKAGDQQAAQIAQMIQQVIQQMQGLATSAKWGAKLSYIKSLKYAKGGKACPACEKKIEMKACGGKKAKKHQEGGIAEKNNIVTTPKRWYKVEQVASGSTDPDVNGMMPRRVVYTYENRMPNDTLYFKNALEEAKANLGPLPTTTQKQQFGRESVDARVFNGMLQKLIKKRYFGGWL